MKGVTKELFKTLKKMKLVESRVRYPDIIINPLSGIV